MVDAVGAVALTLFTQYEVWTSERVAGPLLGQSACFAVATLALAARRRAPLGALVLGSTALTVQTVALGEAAVVGGFLSLLLLTYGVAAYCPLRPAVVGLAVLAAALVAEPVANADVRSAADTLGNLAVFGLLWGAGRLVRQRGQRGVWWEGRARELERHREEQVRAALADERQRIARELHDVVAHSVSVMVLQAGAARQHLTLDPERARQPLLVVEELGREALVELQRLLQLLRQDGEGSLPPAGLEQIDQLVEQSRRAGLDVRMQVDGVRQQLAPGLELTAYRIVQEALTNTAKHAPTAPTTVQVCYTDDELVLAVVNDGVVAAPRPEGTAGGHGLMGMRERVMLYGGRLTAGPREEGGFAVNAHLPLVRAVTGS